VLDGADDQDQRGKHGIVYRDTYIAGWSRPSLSPAGGPSVGERGSGRDVIPALVLYGVVGAMQ
jgi:hypothetical protein